MDDNTYYSWETLRDNLNEVTRNGITYVDDYRWGIQGVDVGNDDDHYDISIDHRTIKEIVEEAVKAILKEEEMANEPITIRIEKYHMKHK